MNRVKTGWCVQKKMVMVVGAFVAGTVLLTSCAQESVIKKLEGSLLQANIQATRLFGYNPDFELVPTQSPEGDVITVTAHGYGSNKKTGKNVANYAPLTGQVLTFNLPDHDYRAGNQHDLRHGSIDEILPLAYAVNTAIRAGAQHINLYGFSAGGGAVINVLGILNSNRFDTQLNAIGITQVDKTAMLNAIKHGVVLLDVPLKSVEEIIDGRGATKELVLFAQKYKENNLRPIDSVDALAGLGLQIVLYFEKPDEILYNRDDAEFIRRLERANSSGTTRVVFGSHGGHVGWHKELWQAYKSPFTTR